MSTTWNKEWILPYQSLWCTFEKFKYANCLSSDDFKTLMKPYIHKRSDFNYRRNVFVEDIDIPLEVQIQLFGEDIIGRSTNDLKLILGSLYTPYNLSYYLNDEFYYCPECIKLGYHSIYHQLNFSDTCIFHNVKLQKGCPSCSLATFLSLLYTNNFSSFRCMCGSTLFTEPFNKCSKTWGDASHLIFLKDIEHYSGQALNNNLYGFSYDAFRKYRGFNDYYTLTHKRLKRYIDNDDYTNFKIEFKPSTDTSIYPITHIETPNILLFGENLDVLYCDIFKSIAKKLRKSHPIKSIISYLKRYSLQLLFSYGSPNASLTLKNINAEAYAYLMWRRDIEGLESYRQVHTRPYGRSANLDESTVKRTMYRSFLYEYYDYEINQYILSVRKDLDKAPYTNHALFSSIISRVLAIMMWQHYQNWLDYIQQQKLLFPDNKPEMDIHLEYRLPYVVAHYDKDENMVYIDYN